VENFQLVIKRKANKNANILIHKNAETKITALRLTDLLDTFQKEHSDTFLIDKNQHTAKLSDSRIAYDVDLQRKYLLPENPELFLIFLCIRIVNYIKTMNLACAYLEDSPSTSDS
jgi:hypothetical protein